LEQVSDLFRRNFDQLLRDSVYSSSALSWPNFNHRKERHLNGTVLESFVRPTILITDAYNALNNQSSRCQRDQESFDMILKVLRGDGNVLLLVETTGHVLEFILCLDQHWVHHYLTYPIAFLTNVTTSTVDYVKSFLE
jgi:cleavage and polyadenylation specificity factor subunit 2